MRALTLITIGISLCACSIFDKPDPGRLDAGAVDAGLDAPDIDADLDGGSDGSLDAGVDGGDAFVCPGAAPENCGDGRDNDCDGLTDCADPECLARGAPECCMGSTREVTETFTVDGTGWTTHTQWSANLFDAIDSEQRLVDMGTGAPIGMVNNSCLEVDLGLQLRFDLQQIATCAGSACVGFMDVVIGPSTTFNGALTEDLAVHAVATPAGIRIDVLQGGSMRGSRTFGVGAITVIVDVAPGLAQSPTGPIPAIVGSVHTFGMDDTPIASNLLVTDRNIFGTSTCHGLRAGVQGHDAQIALDNLRITQRDCSNPGSFGTLGDDSRELDAITMSVSDVARTGGWGHGGIGDPALLEGVVQGSGVHSFTLLFDGSPVDRASDIIGHLPLAIGGAATTAIGSDAYLTLDADCTPWDPRGTTTHCMPASSAATGALITSGRVVRDPTIQPDGRNATSISSFRVVWAGDAVAPSTDRLLYTSLLDATTRMARIDASALTAIDFDPTETCHSFRQPLLLPLLDSTDPPWLLFYICDDTFPSVVHAATFTGGHATRLPHFQLGVAELGSLAAQGVIDVAGVVFDYSITGSSDREATYRLWLTTRPTTITTAVLYVEGHVPAGATDHIPAFVPFAGNPVLNAQSSVFRTACGSGCQLHGITATRITDHLNQVRFLVERWTDDGAGLRYDLVPLLQTWPPDP